MRRNGTLKQYAGDAKRTRTAAMNRAREAQKFIAELGANYSTDIAKRRLHWAVKDARRANRQLVRLLKNIRD